MPTSIPLSTLEKFTTFGDLLRFLRRRAGITQLELSIAVGYSTAQICRLEQNLRLPDPPTIEARFVPALYLEDEPKAVARLLELAAKVKREDAPEPGLSPYKGLEYFDEADASLFVGREALSTKLAECVLALASKKGVDENRFFVIVGASGSGKSSLVRAGLVPSLRWNKRSANWQIHVLTPTAHPLESLATAFTQDTTSAASTTEMMDDLKQDRLGFYIKRELKTTGASQLLLVIDQFEELFTLCHSEDERFAYIDNLLTVSSVDDGQAIIVITLRADFYAHCASYPQLRQVLARYQEYIGSMNDEEMRRAIEEPARRERWEFEPGSVDLILHDVGHEPGALPLLSHALLETWQRRHGRTLTLSGYASAGGVRGAIAETAEAVFTDQFNHAQQAIARRIFLRLTELGDETATGDTRRRASFNELILKPEETDATQAVLNALVDARLITTSEDSVQVAHEALIREWPTLRGWLEDNREGLRLHRQLTEAAQDWQAAERDPDMLFRGARLVQAREWAATHSDDLNILEREFLDESVASSEREAAEREATHLRELEAVQKLAEAERWRAEEEGRSANMLRRRAIYLGLALGITFALVVVAIIFARQASLNAEQADNQRSTSEAASIKAISEANIRATAEAKAVTQQSLAEAASTQAIYQANIRATAEANALAIAEINRSLRLAGLAQLVNQSGLGDTALALAMEAVNVDQPPLEALKALRNIAASPGTRFILNGHSHVVYAVAISPDNHRAFSGSCTKLNDKGSCLLGELILWDLDGRKELRRWSAHAGKVNVVAFSPDGQILISGGEDGTVILWNANTGDEIRQLSGYSGGIIGLALTTAMEASDGALLSGSADGTLILSDLATGTVLQSFKRNTSQPTQLTNLAVAAKSRIAVTGYTDGSLVLWDLDNAQIIRKLDVSGDPVGGVAITADGKILISNAGLSLRTIDAQTGEVIAEHSTAVIQGWVRLSPDEKSAFAGYGDGIIQVDIENMREKQWMETGTDVGDSTALGISQDGQLGITGYSNGTLRLWNLVESLDYQTFKTGLPFPDALSISPDGQTLILGNSSPGTQSPVLWDITGARIFRTLHGFNYLTSPDSVAISPDGRYAAAGGGVILSNKPELVLWNLESGEFCHLEWGHRSLVRSLAFSPDSRLLLAGSQTSNNLELRQDLILWDVRSCQLVRRFDMNELEDVTGIAFSSDGKWAATGSAYNQRVILWDVNTGREIRRFVVPGNVSYLPFFDVAFGPGDRTILACGRGPLYLWDVATGNIIRRYYGHTAKIIWSLDISPDGKYILSGGDNGEVILWDFATGEELSRLSALTNPILSVKFSLDTEYAYAISTDGLLSRWRLSVKSTPELLVWIQANRYVRILTCGERQRYRVEPLCEQGSP